jgi:two-component system cell cycle response regulator DivK
MTKILYVEDNEDNIFMLTRRLSRRGYDVSVAKDGEEGIQKALSEQPDLILMDVVLPLLGGLEATRKLKSLPDTRQIPVIAVSSRAMSGDRDKALAAGCDDYHTKPIEFERLLETISAHLPDHDAD